MAIRSWLVTVVLLAACSDPSRPPPVGPTAVPPPDASPGGDGGAGVANPTAPPEAAARTAPHHAPITAAAIDRGGTAALTLDSLGDVRLWRALDGTQAPLAMPFHGARGLDLVRDGGAIVIGRIDASGAAHLHRFAAGGAMVATASAPPTPAALGLVALGPDAWLLVRADHSLALVDASGAVIDEHAQTGVRLEALRPMGARGALAIASRIDGGDTAYASVPVTIANRAIVWGAETPLPIAPATPVELAVSPDGTRLAYFADPEDVVAVKAKPVRAPAQRPAGPAAPMAGVAHRRRRPVPQPALPPVSVVVATIGGDVITPAELIEARVSTPQRLGFSSDDTLHAFGAGSGDLTISLDGEGSVVPGALPRTSAPAIGPGLIVTGADHNLLVQRVGGTTRYLGYQLGAPALAALSPDGSRAAWATADGQILIDTLDGSAPDVSIGQVLGGVAAIDFLDAGHLLVVGQRGELTLRETARGTQVASVTAPGAAYSVQVDRRTGWVVGVREGGGVWSLRAQPGRSPPWTEPKVIADGSMHFWLLEGGSPLAPALVTLDNDNEARIYSGSQLASGLAVGEVRKIAKSKLPNRPAYIDPTGRPFVFAGDQVRAADRLGGPDRTFATLSAPRDLTRAPTGDVFLLFDQERTAYALGPDGTVRWTQGVGSAGWRPAFSLDGRRVALVSGSGGQVLDVATGTLVAARCGWQFGAYAAAPLSVAPQVHPICE